MSTSQSIKTSTNNSEEMSCLASLSWCEPPHFPRILSFVCLFAIDCSSCFRTLISCNCSNRVELEEESEIERETETEIENENETKSAVTLFSEVLREEGQGLPQLERAAQSTQKYRQT